MTATTVHLKDYTPFPFVVKQVHLNFDLGETATITGTFQIQAKKQDVYCDRLECDQRLPCAAHNQGSRGFLKLHGADTLKLESVFLDGVRLTEGVDGFVVSEGALTVSVPTTQQFTLGIVVTVQPLTNTALYGLYKSSGIFCTQCEAEGFRRMMYFPDRPDVLSRYTVRIVADKTESPILLSNGNLVAEGDLPGGRHYAIWVDPWPKPCYLFALVAGDLVPTRGTFTTMSGKEVQLCIWTQAHNADKTTHAMKSVKKAMKWDEEVYGREYDLALFNIVAVDDFNMGAMENKGLNIFNSRLILCSAETATDDHYAVIEGVIGHEYFHNWSGNRVTCRDWFQLSLKEGFTVFRDSNFSADMQSRPVKRIDFVRTLRTRQFPEDAGAMAHPVRPASYQKIDNFYTMTIYEKGAEVIGMYHTLLGSANFRKATDLYFNRHDGQAATVDDMYQAMVDTYPELARMGDFKLWYSQAGTPVVHVSTDYDEASQTFKLALSQTLPATADAPHTTKQPQVIPVAVGLLDSKGQDILPEKTAVLCLNQASQNFEFKGISERPVVCSVFRGFSAPVKIKYEQTTDELLFQLAHDTDEFNRYEAGQKLFTAAILEAHAHPDEVKLNPKLVEAVRRVLTHSSLDHLFIANVLSLPGVAELIADIAEADPLAMHTARSAVVNSLATALESDFKAVFDACCSSNPYEFTKSEMGRRTLRNTSLSFLVSTGKQAYIDLARECFVSATSMTDAHAAVSILSRVNCAARETSLNELYEKYKDEQLVLVTWLRIQASAELPGNVPALRALMDHPAFDIKNPNKCYAMWVGMSLSTTSLHAADGSGYQFLADAVIACDKVNPQVASRIVQPFTKIKAYDQPRQALMRKELERLAGAGLSANPLELVNASLRSCC